MKPKGFNLYFEINMAAPLLPKIFFAFTVLKCDWGWAKWSEQLNCLFPFIQSTPQIHSGLAWTLALVPSVLVPSLTSCWTGLGPKASTGPAAWAWPPDLECTEPLLCPASNTLRLNWIPVHRKRTTLAWEEKVAWPFFHHSLGDHLCFGKACT